jgi:hypothetical protein
MAAGRAIADARLFSHGGPISDGGLFSTNGPIVDGGLFSHGGPNAAAARFSDGGLIADHGWIADDASIADGPLVAQQHLRAGDRPIGRRVRFACSQGRRIELQHHAHGLGLRFGAAGREAGLFLHLRLDRPGSGLPLVRARFARSVPRGRWRRPPRDLGPVRGVAAARA